MKWFTGRNGMARWGMASVGLLIMAVGLAACSDESLTDASTSAALSDTDAGVILSDLTDDLGLTDEQKTALHTIAKEYTGRMAEPGVTWYAAADVRDVLTSDQIAQLAARREELGDRIRDRMRGGGALRQGRDGTGFRPRGMRRDGGAGRGIGGGPWADDELGLTDDQLSAIRLILEKYRPQMEAIRDQVRNGTLTRDEARAQTATIRDDIRTEIEALLTPEQLETMNRRWQDLEDRRGDREQRREQAQAAMADALGLTAEQQTQIDALRDSPKTEGSRAERREAHRSAFEAILTTEQLEIVTIHEAMRGYGVLRRLSGEQGFGPGAGRGPGARGGFERVFGGGD